MMSLKGDTMNTGPPTDRRSRSIAFVVGGSLTTPYLRNAFGLSQHVVQSLLFARQKLLTRSIK